MEAQETHPGAAERVTIHVTGRVQGVGFRWWTRARALELGLTGYARNTDHARVEVCAEGPREQLERLVVLLDEFPSTTRRPGLVRTLSPPLWGRAHGEYQDFRER